MPVVNMQGQPVDPSPDEVNVQQFLQHADSVFSALRQDCYDNPTKYRHLRIGKDTVRSILYRIQRNMNYISETSKLR